MYNPQYMAQNLFLISIFYIIFYKCSRGGAKVGRRRSKAARTVARSLAPVSQVAAGVSCVDGLKNSFF